MGGKYQFFQSNVENLFVNQMKNDNTLTQYIITNKPPVNTVAGTQTISFWKIKRKHKAKTAAQAQIQILSPPVD